MKTIAAMLMASTLLFPGVAAGAPPPEGSEDWNLMMPFRDWFIHQHDRRGYWCCDIGDGRPVEARMSVDSPIGSKNNIKDMVVHWWVHVTPQHFPNEEDRWMMVPENKIIQGGNPTGVPVLWLLNGTVQCFAPGSMM